MFPLPPGYPGWSWVQELLSFYWNRLHYYLESGYDRIAWFFFHYHPTLTQFIDNDLPQVTRLKNEFWLNYRDEIERRGLLVTFGTIGLFRTLLHWYVDFNTKIEELFGTLYNNVYVLNSLRYTALESLATGLYPVLYNLVTTSGQKWLDLNFKMFTELFNIAHYDNVGLLEIFRRFRARLGLLVGVQSDRVEGIVGANFTRLYQMIAGSYPRLYDLTIAKNTNIWDLLNVTGPIIDLVARHQAGLAIERATLALRDMRLFVEKWEAIWNTLYIFTDGRSTFIVTWIKEKLFPIANDPLGWLDAWLKELLLKRGEAFFRWVFGV